MRKMYILLIIIIKLVFNLCEKNNETDLNKYIVIPFSIEEENAKYIKEYNTDIFIKNNYLKNLILYFNLGSPFQKINGFILNDNLCFELKEKSNISSINLQDKYKPKDSSSFTFFKRVIYHTYQNNEYMNIGYDFISFENNPEKQNISFLFLQSEDPNKTIDDFSDKEYFAKIGLDKPLYYYHDNCPNFICEIKEKFSLNKYTISFEFINSNKGNLIIGNELYFYNHKKYFNSQYVKTYINDNFEIFFDDIIVSDKNIHNTSFNGTYANFDFNLGIIIGSKEYKKIIDDIFFNKYISEEICQVENITYNSTQNYLIYSCIDKKIDLKLFPKLIFVSKNYLYNFIFDYSSLFIKKSNNKYYFLIIFKANNIPKFKDIWILGQPFYYKYAFTLDIDQKTLCFYNPDLPIDKDELPNENHNINFKKIIIIFLLVILIIGLFILTFFLGKKYNEQRKKRANELKDDNYEYFPESNEKNEIGI